VEDLPGFAGDLGRVLIKPVQCLLRLNGCIAAR
jgi:hypothetical protein